MGQIVVEKNVAGIEGLCVISPAVHGTAVDTSWKPTVSVTWKKTELM